MKVDGASPCEYRSSAHITYLLSASFLHVSSPPLARGESSVAHRLGALEVELGQLGPVGGLVRELLVRVPSDLGEEVGGGRRLG